MVQLKVYPFEGAPETDAIFLDLYETQPIKLTLSIEDVTSADATSVFSRTFKVPATRDNNEFFQNAWELDGIDFDITIKKPAEILVDGAEFKIGHVRLQKIFSNADLDKIDYELLFLGETRDFSSAVGELTLCQLTFTDFSWDDLPVNYTNAAAFTSGIGQQAVRDSWDAFPSISGPGTPTAGYADGDLLFPLIDHGNSYDQQGDVNAPVIALDDGATNFAFTHHNHALPAERFKPMIRAKRIWDQIFQDSGYTYQSNFLDSEQFLHMYVSAFGNQEQITIGVEQEVGGVFQGSNSGNTFEYFEQPNGNNDVQSYLYCSNMVLDSPKYNVGLPDVGGGPGGGSYMESSGPAVLGGAYYAFEFGAQVDAQIENSDYGYTAIDSAVQLCIVDAPGGTILQTLATGNFTSNGNWSSGAYDSRNGGYQPTSNDIFQIFITNNGSYDISQVDQAYWSCEAAPGQYSPSNDLDCEYQQIDFIKDVITMFRLVMQPDPLRPNHFIIEPWKDFIGSGDVYDWSDKMIRQKDFVSEPLFNTQSAIIEFTKQEDEDYINKFHQDNNKHAYGWLRFDSGNELLKGERELEVAGIAPTPIEQITVFVSNLPNARKFILPQIFEVDENKRLPIKPKTRFLFYNGMVPAYDTWYYKTGSGTGDHAAMVTYPLVSPYEYWPIENEVGPPATNTLNLNFANDTRYYMDPDPNDYDANDDPIPPDFAQIPNTLFEIFWARYVSSLYNKFSRRVTAYFTLNNVDLQNLTFDDIIFIDGKYYRPEKVIDAQIGQRTAVKVQLINVLDQRPVWRPEPLTGFSIITQDGICAGESGSIQVTTNGTPPFVWSLDAGQTGQYNAPVGQAPYIFTIDGVPLGSGNLEVEDSFGRTATAAYTVNAASATPVVATWTETDATDCTAPCNGSISVTPSGGQGPYTITWQDPNVSGLNPTGLCPNDYLFYITDALGCTSDTYEASVSCSVVTYTYQLREHLNNCSQSSAQTYIATSTNVYAPQTTVDLNERGGCYYIQSTSTDTPTYTIGTDYPDCASCTPVTPVSYEVENCNGGSPKFISRSPYTLQPGQIVKLQNTSGCWQVIGDSTTASTDTATQLYRSCAVCEGIGTGFQYYATFCDGLTPPYNFQSPIALQIGDVMEVLDGTFAGRCVTIVLENQGATTFGNLDTSTIFDDCSSCEGTTLQTCHSVVVSGGGAEISYEQNGNTFTESLSGFGTYNRCGTNFQLISGSATFADKFTVCIGNRDCLLRVRTSCHTLYGGSQFPGSTFEYRDAGNALQTITVQPFTTEVICAQINSVNRTSGNGSFLDNQSLCITSGDCFSDFPGDPIP